MSNKKKEVRRIRVRSVRRDPPDLQKLSRALIEIALAQAQAEADAEAQHGAAETAGTERHEKEDERAA